MSVSPTCSRWYGRLCAGMLAVLLALSAVSCQRSAGSVPDPADTRTDSASDAPIPTLTVRPDPEAGVTRPVEKPAPEAPVLPAPTMSAAGGIYTQSVTLTASAPEGYCIRYTTDGSVPDGRSPVFPASLQVAARPGAVHVIRAACFDGGRKPVGPVVTNTYIRAEQTVNTRYTVMIAVNERDLDRMEADVQAPIERPAHLELVTPDGKTVLSQDVGLRLFGGSSRGLPQKSFRITARRTGYFGEDPAYAGKGSFHYPLFPERRVPAGPDQGKVLDRFDSLILRNGGNDSLQSSACDPMDPALIRDGLANEFAARYAPHVVSSLSHFTDVYVNGRYYGMLDLRENLNDQTVRRLYGVDDADVVVVKSELDTTRHCDRHSNGAQCRFCNVWFYYETQDDPRARGEMADWVDLCRRASEAVHADETAFRTLFREVESKIDLESLKEYYTLNLFLCNTDWPHNNVKLFRYTGAPQEGNPVTDGKWRFMTRDMDMSMARYQSAPLPELDTRADTDMFRWILGNYIDGYADRQTYPDSLYLQGLFAFCMRDEGFRRDFAAFARELASEEAQTALLALYEEMYDQLSGGMRAHIAAWQGTIPAGYGEGPWRRAAGNVKAFIRRRPEAFLRHLDGMLAEFP